MSKISEHIEQACLQVIHQITGEAISEIPSPTVSTTRKEFEGDFTIVVFPYLRLMKSKPEDAAQQIGALMVKEYDFIQSFNVVKGFLNLKMNEDNWAKDLYNIYLHKHFGLSEPKGQKFMVEFSSPNTNKPLHLGHIRNILLGWSACQLLEAAGYEVIKTQVVNDRGIAICKSMLAWQHFGDGATPDASNVKGDHFVGKYYVLFEKKFQEEYASWQQTSEGKTVYSNHQKEDETPDLFFKRYKNTYFNNFSDLGSQARNLLQQWENGDEATIAIWKTMNEWVYQGFDVTYKELGVHFDKIYYESDTYLKGKEIVEEGLNLGIFSKEKDGSVWADLTDINMDRKIILRSDGTAVYITQDLGTAQLRYEDYKMDKAVYVVADEQDYHFVVLFELLKRLKRPFADGLYHLNYGMVDLPSGKMKSREGTVVDADDLILDVINEARKSAKERGELEELTVGERDAIYTKVGLAALKFFILKVNPRRRMTFDPKESVDMQGQTGPYIQNAFVRINSVLGKSGEINEVLSAEYDAPSELEKGIIKSLMAFPDIIKEAAEGLDPSTMANYLYNLSKSYHRFYHEHRILTAETEAAKSFRLLLSAVTGRTIERGMRLLGIEMPDKM
jgi:arginyl-tRNA synthetase